MVEDAAGWLGRAIRQRPAVLDRRRQDHLRPRRQARSREHRANRPEHVLPRAIHPRCGGAYTRPRETPTGHPRREDCRARPIAASGLQTRRPGYRASRPRRLFPAAAALDTKAARRRPRRHPGPRRPAGPMGIRRIPPRLVGARLPVDQYPPTIPKPR